MRRLLKFLHTVGGAGFLGAAAALIVLIHVATFGPSPPAYGWTRAAMAAIGAWIFLPSLTLTLVAGLAAIGVNRAFHEAGWAWLKAATGILVFAGGLHALAPIQDEAKRAAEALASGADPATITGAFDGEEATLWVLLIVSLANVALGVWRPRLLRRRAR